MKKTILQPCATISHFIFISKIKKQNDNVNLQHIKKLTYLTPKEKSLALFTAHKQLNRNP